ncbi:MAG: SEL1-like repeat protein, partial [Reyranella sp.]|nr:SEL1-like repeat protein [Reyranella sp.]
MPSRSLDWAGMPAGELRDRADAGSIAAMEELARRLVQGIGMPKDPQAGAGWLLRAAQSGSAQSAFNVAVMYERGFMLERNFAKAIEWYRRAVEADLAIAKHNLALMLRDGKGAARNGREAIELLQSAARQGMAASMFSLGDIYERGDAAPKDVPMAMAWFAITAEFERQANRGAETALAKTSATRALALQRGLMQEDLQKAEQIGQVEFRRIVEAMQRPARPQVRLTPLPPVEVAAAIPPPAPPRTGALPPLPPADLDPPDWPKASKDQVRIVQKALFDLKLLRDKPDGALGPMTRAAIRTFQRINAQRETGEPTKELYASLKEAVARRDSAPPARPETKPEPPVAVASARPPEAETTKVEPPKPIMIAASNPPPPPPSSDDITRLMPAPPEPPKPIELAAAETTPPPS